MSAMRIIHFINQDTGKERIQFTEDLISDPEDFNMPGSILQSDSTVHIDMPGTFPSEHAFETAAD